MGRQVKRVPVGWAWPINTPWIGFTNPWSGFMADCSTCAGFGGDADEPCPDCDKGAVWFHPDAKAKYEAWKDMQPPTGEGWQLWETVSEGSPISPAMESPEALARWLSEQRGGWFRNGTDYETWLRFLRGPGWAPSMVVENGVVKDGVNAVAGGAA